MRQISVRPRTAEDDQKYFAMSEKLKGSDSLVMTLSDVWAVWRHVKKYKSNPLGRLQLTEDTKLEGEEEGF